MILLVQGATAARYKQTHFRALQVGQIGTKGLKAFAFLREGSDYFWDGYEGFVLFFTYYIYNKNFIPLILVSLTQSTQHVFDL